MSSFTIAILSFIDIYREFISNESTGHLIYEMIIAVTASALAFTLLKNLQETKSELRVTRIELEDKLKENEQWRSDYNRILKGVSSAIQDQFDGCNLTPAEKDVGLLLLKGLSYKEIAEVRQTSEKTVRQQASVIYQKSLLPGRAELSAYFLDDFLIEQKKLAF